MKPKSSAASTMGEPSMAPVPHNAPMRLPLLRWACSRRTG